MTDHKVEWHEALKKFEEAKMFLAKPRCIGCEKFSPEGACQVYGQVPSEIHYMPQDCGEYELYIPF